MLYWSDKITTNRVISTTIYNSFQGNLHIENVKIIILEIHKETK